jgi:hypothetical protein
MQHPDPLAAAYHLDQGAPSLVCLSDAELGEAGVPLVARRLPVADEVDRKGGQLNAPASRRPAPGIAGR